MHRKYIFLIAISLVLAGTVAAQEAQDNSSATVKGCLSRSRGNYLVVEDKTGLVYALKGVGSKLDGQSGHEVEVTGSLQPGTVKTGVRSTKDGSNPADTVHGVEGTPLQVNDVSTDVKTISRRCKAADAK